MALQDALDKQFDKTLPDRLDRIAKLLEKNDIKPEDVGKIGRIKNIQLKDWQMGSTDADGNPQVTDLNGTTIQIDPRWAEGPDWPVVQPARPLTVKPTKSTRKHTSGWYTAVILPDPQIGYRRFEDGTMDPFHDEAAMNVALQIVRSLRPDVIVNLGDVMDLPEFGTYEQEPAFAFTTQPTLDRTSLFFAEQRANAPEAEISYIEGNHDRRLQKSIIKNAKSAFGLRVANSAPESWPVLSIPHLLNLDSIGVEYIQGYPAGEKWINDNLVCIHGSKVKSAGSTASLVIDDERVSVIFGHVHRIELQHKTRRTRAGAKRNFSATPGCLCRTDGAVPSTKSSTDCMGRALTSWENWQQGLGVVRFQEGDGRFNLEIVPIYDGTAIFRDKEFTAT